jgi:hypothetical protein
MSAHRPAGLVDRPDAWKQNHADRTAQGGQDRTRHVPYRPVDRRPDRIRRMETKNISTRGTRYGMGEAPDAPTMAPSLYDPWPNHDD